jgi:hypothetical protein
MMALLIVSVRLMNDNFVVKKRRLFPQFVIDVGVQINASEVSSRV